MHVLTLLQVSKDDLSAFQEAVSRYWEDLMPHAPVVRDPERRAVYFREQFRLDDDSSIHRWACVGGSRVGFVKIDLWENHDGLGATIRDFFIERPFRRQGIGMAFATRIVEALAERGIHRIDLNVRADNPAALAFWQSAGFDLSLYQLRRYL